VTDRSAGGATGTRVAADPAKERRIRRTVRGGAAVLGVLARTWRVRVVHEEGLRRLRDERRSFVFACWHGELLPLLWHHRRQNVHILVSEHRDGEIIARVAERLGFGTVRGSTTRGGGRALLALARVLQEGHDVAVTPDGPRGPRHHYAPGALVAAQRAGAPVLPVAVHVDRAWRLRSWDRFIVPKPFARITVAYAEPAWVQGDTPRDAAAETERFVALQREAMRRAYAAAGAGVPTDDAPSADASA
jgi:lysophospholipid acyltransferase (LPLAT)-like uncharacterized protein